MVFRFHFFICFLSFLEWCKNDAQLQARIAINTGPALVGNLGSLDRMNYTCIGDTVNVTSRLERLNHVYGTEILIAEGTYRQVKSAFLCRYINRTKLKGKKNYVNIYELVCRRNQTTKTISEQITRFNHAMKSLRDGDLSIARTRFEDYVKLYPNDKCAQYHLSELTDLKDANISHRSSYDLNLSTYTFSSFAESDVLHRDPNSRGSLPSYLLPDPST